MRTAIAGALALALAMPVWIADAAAPAGAWRANAAQSTIGFTARQAGADFEGRFARMSAQIAFDPKKLGASSFDVTIDLRSVDTRDEDRDTTLKGADLFWVEKYPQATYVAKKFVAGPKGTYRADGKLTLRNVTRDVPVTFTFERQASAALLKGDALVKRLDFGVGQGDWASTEWVANEVKVHFNLRLQP